jgi:hypothetical protein
MCTLSFEYNMYILLQEWLICKTEIDVNENKYDTVIRKQSSEELLLNKIGIFYVTNGLLLCYFWVC